MDINAILSFALAATAGVLGYFIRRLISAADQLRRDFEEERRRTADQIAIIRDSYLRYDEFVRFQTSIDQKLTKIYDILVCQ